ncbi:hypothetical protein K7X08_022415 [Anisodus acutangulus]|uniref:Uncharacterized protein n=1 Tax=Anisodus acutangulus TaxID=402998 RepID=A0A9Q1MHN4_9SOLA|nr:hypothetical protein K7X08_022415 [Anisodus acutangulus]
MFQEPLSSGADKTVQLGADCFSGQKILNESKASTSKNNTSRKRMLDLELPAEKSIDNDDENPVKRTNILISELQPQRSSKVNFVNSSSSFSSCRDTFLLFDLNEPVQPFESGCPNSVFESNNIHEEIRDRDLDLSGARIDNKLSTTNICIDLNSCMKEDLLSSSPSEATKSTAEKDLEGPVSPENKECSPPRGDSQDNKISTSIHLPRKGHNDPIEELDRVAADILIFISSSAKTVIGEPSEASKNCLFRLAEVAMYLASSPHNEVDQPIVDDSLCHFKVAKEK